MLRNFILAVAFAVLVYGIGGSPSRLCAQGSHSTADRQYYLAALAAAEKSLRLGEVAEARRWLEQAPKSLRGWEWSFLNTQLDESATSVELDSEQITSIAAAGNGRLLATADANGNIVLRDAEDLAVVRKIGDHTQAV